VDLLQFVVGNNLLVFGGLARGNNGLQRLLEGEGFDSQVEEFDFLDNVFRGLERDGNLSLLVKGDLSFDRDGGVGSILDTSTDELLGEGGDDTQSGFELGINDRLDDGLQNSGNRGFGFSGDLLLGLEEALDRVDNGEDSFMVNGETSFRGADHLQFQKVDSLGVFIFQTFGEDLGVGSEFIGNLLQSLEVDFGVEGEKTFKTHESKAKVSFRFSNFALLDLEGFLELLKFSSDGGSGFRGKTSDIQELFEDVVHTLRVQREFQTLNGERLTDDVGRHGNFVGDKGFFSVDKSHAIFKDNLQTLEELATMDVVRELDTTVNTLDQGQDVFNVLSDGEKSGRFSVLQALEGGVNEGGNLSGRFEPGAEGDLLKFTHGGSGEGKDSDRSDTDLGVFSGVVDQRKNDGVDLGRVLGGNTLEGVDSHGSDKGLLGDFTFDDLDQGSDGLVMTELAKSMDNGNLEFGRLANGRFQFSFQVGDPLFLDEGGFGVAEVTVDTDREFRNHGSGVDAGTVEKVRESDGRDREHLVSLGLGGLDQRQDHVQNFGSGGLDILEGGLQNLGGNFSGDFTGFDQFLDKDDSGVGTNHGQNVVVEERGNLLGFVTLSFHGSEDLSLDFLKFFDSQGAESLGDGDDVTGNIGGSGARFGRFEGFSDDLVHKFSDLAVQFGLGNGGGVHELGSRVQFGHGLDGVEAGEGLHLFFDVGSLNGAHVFTETLGAQHLLFGVFQNQRLVGLGFGGLGKGSVTGTLNLEEFEFDGGKGLNLFFDIPAIGVGGNLVIGGHLADGELFRATANDVAGSGEVHHGFRAFGLGGVAAILQTTGDGREDGTFTAVVEVLGLGDLVVLLALADFFGFSGFLQDLFFSHLGLEGGEVLDSLDLEDSPLFFHFSSLVQRKRVDGVGSFAVTLGRGFHGLEEGDVVHLAVFLDLFAGEDEVVQLLNGTLANTGDVGLDLGQEGLLDVGDNDGFVLFDEEGFDDPTLDVSFEGSHQRTADGFGNFFVGKFGDFQATIDFGDMFVVHGEELGVFELDAEAVVGEGLDLDAGSQLQTGPLGTDAGDTGQNLGLVLVDIFLLGNPTVVRGGVAQGKTHE
jgi:hypothetical protein